MGWGAVLWDAALCQIQGVSARRVVSGQHSFPLPVKDVQSGKGVRSHLGPTADHLVRPPRAFCSIQHLPSKAWGKADGASAMDKQVSTITAKDPRTRHLPHQPPLREISAESHPSSRHPLECHHYPRDHPPSGSGLGRPESEATAKLPAARSERNHTNGGGETAGQELPSSLHTEGSSTPVLENSESKHPPAGEPRQTIQEESRGWLWGSHAPQEDQQRQTLSPTQSAM